MQNQVQKKDVSLNVGYLHGPARGHNCGYCHNKTGSFTSGFDTDALDPDIYKSLMDCGWRRCGSYFYKPDLEKSCCKCYTIRMNATQFQIKKSQKKSLHKWNQFIYRKENIEEEKNKKLPDNRENDLLKQKGKEIHEEMNTSKNSNSGKIVIDYTKQTEIQLELRLQMIEVAKQLEDQKQKGQLNELSKLGIKLDSLSFVKESIISDFKILPSRCLQKGDYFTNYIMLFLARNKESFGVIKNPIVLEALQETLKNVLVEKVPNCQCQLNPTGQINFFKKQEIKKEVVVLEEEEKKEDKAVNKSHEIENQILPEEVVTDNNNLSDPQNSQITLNQQNKNHEVYQQHMEIENQREEIPKKKKKNIIDAEKKEKNKNEELNQKKEEEKPTEHTFSWPSDKYTFQEIKKGRLTIKIQLAKADQVNYALYQKYCQKVHDKDKDSFDGFKGFLCEKTLTFGIKQSETVKDAKMLVGCFHMNYFLDEKFIGVGVVDLTSEALSSVYFFYDPDYKNYSLGVIASLYEIEYIQYINTSFPQFQYYYLGFYIQNCQKMVYKGDYAPSELVCPRTYRWYPLNAEMRLHLDSKPKTASLAPATEVIDPKMSHTQTPKILEKFVNENTRTSFNQIIMPLNQFLAFFNSSLKNIFLEIASCIDKNVYPQVLFTYNK